MNYQFSLSSLLIIIYLSYIYGQQKVDIKPIQVNQIYLKYPDQLFYIIYNVFYNSIDQNYYQSRRSCLEQFDKQLKLIEEPKDIEKDLICVPKNQNMTSILNGCNIQSDNVYTSLQCHNKIFFLRNKDMVQGIKEIKMNNSTSQMKDEGEKGYYRIRISDYVSPYENILKISQNEYQACYLTTNFLQCLQFHEDGISKLKDPLYLLDDQDNQSKLNNNSTRNLNDQNSTSEENQKEPSEIQDDLIFGSEEEKSKRKILTFDQITYQTNKSIILIIPEQLADEDLHFISIHAEKYLFDFVSQQSVVKFSPSQINFNVQTNIILNVQMILNEQRGSVNAFLITTEGVWVFEIQIKFNQKTDMQFVAKLEQKVDVFSMNRNIFTVFNKQQNKLSIYRFLEFSQNIQFIADYDETITNKNEKIITRVFTNKNDSKIHKNLPAQYLIYLVNTNTMKQTIISLSEFSQSQKYLTPLHQIIQKNQDILLDFKVNQGDYQNFTFAPQELDDYEKIQEQIVDVQFIKESSSRHYLMYSTNQAIYVEPICFPNNQLFNTEDDFITSYTYNGCIPCEFSTYSENVNLSQCLKINNTISQNNSISQINFSPFQLINFQENCSSQDFKGPLCQTCSGYQDDFLKGENNIKLINQNSTQQSGQTVCQYQCEEKNTDQNYIKGSVEKDIFSILQKRKLVINEDNSKVLNEKNSSRILKNHGAVTLNQSLNKGEQSIIEFLSVNRSDAQSKGFVKASLNDKIRNLDNNQNLKNEEDTSKNKANENNDTNTNLNNSSNDQNQQENQNQKKLLNTPTECIEESQESEYNNFCSKLKDCYSCSHHPFCIFNPIEKKCQKLNNYKQPSNLNYQQFILQNLTESSKTLLEYQKYESCSVIQHQKVCPFSYTTSKYRGEFQFYRNQKKKDSKKLEEKKEGIEIKIEDGDGVEYNQVEQFQVCSWYVNTDKAYQDFEYEIKIHLQEGFVQGKESVRAILGICYKEVPDLVGDKSQQSCKLTKMVMMLNQSTSQSLKFGGGKFRFILQFMEKAQIDTSKVQITFTPVTNYDKQYIVVVCILVIISIFLLLIVLLIFKNKILYCIRVKFNTLYFLDWEDSTELHNFTIKQIIKKLERQKLLKLKSQSSYHSENQYQHTDCSICLLDFESADPLYVLVCSHIFHQHCFEEWVKVQFNPVTCPNCKIPLNSSAFTKIEQQKQQLMQQKNGNVNNQNSQAYQEQQHSIQMVNTSVQEAVNHDSQEGLEVDNLINANTISIR